MVPERPKPVKAVADSTEPRPRRSRAKYRVDPSTSIKDPVSNAKAADSSQAEVVAGQMSMESMDTGALLAEARKFDAKAKDRKRKAIKANLKLKTSIEIPHRRKNEGLIRKDEGQILPSFSDDIQMCGGKDKMLMRLWLESEANSGTNPGLRWFNKEDKTIKISWRHGSRSEWSTDDVAAFKCWAQHTGRYDSMTLDYKRWKANFRCALNSLPDVVEVKDERSTKTSDPYKVYRLLPPCPPKKRRRSSVKSVQSPSAEATHMAEESSIQSNSVVTELLEPLEPLPQDLLQLIQLQNEQVFAWLPGGHIAAVDNQTMEIENLMPLNISFAYLDDHCYAGADNAALNASSVSLPVPSSPLPPPPPPAPFNAVIPLPVQALIDTSEEFQPTTTPIENSENVTDVNLNELLLLTDIQGVVSSSNSSAAFLESVFQVGMTLPESNSFAGRNA